MLKLRSNLIIVSAFLMVLVNCDETGYKKYQSVLDQELASGHRVDSLLLGIHFGMTQKEFYLHCWEMNKKGLFTDGAGNTAVAYKIHDELRFPATMNFYPDFHAGRVSKMGASFRYDGWAPWNKHMISDSLKEDVLQLYKNWYDNGPPFMKILDKDRGIIYIKVDGNRRIIIGSYDDAHVKVDYTDLFIEKNLKK